jgi:DDE superfamily endonuclease
LDVESGQLISWQRRAFDHGTFLRYLQAVAAQYPAAWRIYIVLDNWPVHFHPRVQAGLQAGRIELVRLPTYAPWLNPVEKVWRKLYQERLHHHRQATDWPGLQATVQQWLDSYATPSRELLHYTGVLPN